VSVTKSTAVLPHGFKMTTFSPGLRIDVLPLSSFASDLVDVAFVLRYLSRPRSDFSKRLLSWLQGADLPQDDVPKIALVRDQGEIVAWARTEPWVDAEKHEWPTLEAFVSATHRRRGFAAAASMALAADCLCASHVAVFRPEMLLVAARAGLKPTLYKQDEYGVWERYA